MPEALCTDKNLKMCPLWAQRGECEANPDYMQTELRPVVLEESRGLHQTQTHSCLVLGSRSIIGLGIWCLHARYLHRHCLREMRRGFPMGPPCHQDPRRHLRHRPRRPRGPPPRPPRHLPRFRCPRLCLNRYPRHMLRRCNGCADGHPCASNLLASCHPRRKHPSFGACPARVHLPDHDGSHGQSSHHSPRHDVRERGALRLDQQAAPLPRRRGACNPQTHPPTLRPLTPRTPLHAKQGPGTLELHQIAPNFALRQLMEAWITDHAA